MAASSSQHSTSNPSMIDAPLVLVLYDRQHEVLFGSNFFYQHVLHKKVHTLTQTIFLRVGIVAAIVNDCVLMQCWYGGIAAIVRKTMMWK